MRKVVTLSIFSLFLGACVSNDAVEGVAESPVHYIDLTSKEYKERVKEYWVVETSQHPKYPISAARKRVSGCVDVIVGIKKDGRMGEYKVKKSYPEGIFDQSAIAVLKHWKWTSTQENTDSAPVLTTVQLDFMVDGAKNKSEAETLCGFTHI
ncbi:energy transducer TonB [uncultured Shewanella sp.]|uniref:energy transducer TonB n=1 Tax=uncultured Shewanella sp. TaxID=173975 RepID=UPI0026073E99|nr:energy transducer TonB [uncultured Shewanella sp.]